MTVVVPNVPTPVPSRADPVNFAARADAYHEALPITVDALNLQNAENNALNAATNATKLQVDATKAAAVSETTAIKDLALAAQTAAEVAAANAAATNGGQLWVSGTTYAAGYLVYSPLNKRSYRRLVAGAGTVDPSLDPTNWGLLSVVVEQSDIGTAPNEVPLCGFLGDLAFMSSNSLVLKPAASADPGGLGSMIFQLTNDTTLVIKVKGSDGTVRSTTLTLA